MSLQREPVMMPRRCAFLLFRVPALCLTLVLSACLVLTATGLRENVFEADAAVVLGNQVFPDGTPSPRLAARLDRAVRLYREGLCPVIIVSGGVGKEGVDEAAAMAGYLFRHGVPERAVILDASGVNTAATARFAARWLSENDGSSILAVSQYFHLPRTSLALERQGVPAVGTACADWLEWRDLFSVPRELAALVLYALRGDI